LPKPPFPFQLAPPAWSMPRALGRKPPASRGRGGSRRGALSAPALQGRTSAVAFHFHPVGGERRVAYRGYVSHKPEVSFTGVRSPPLRGVDHPI